VIEAGELQRRVDEISWYHRIDLGHGIVTPGRGPVVSTGAMPGVRGKRVLDIGAWDGYYSFLAERLGAAEVVSLDHYAWGIDWDARLAYWNDCHRHGLLPDPTVDEERFWRPDLPGRRGFDLAHEALGSRARPVCTDFMTADLAELGVFDVVLYLGVLYHMTEPLTALQRVREVTGEVALIETEVLWCRQDRSEPLVKFFAGDELSQDYGNWYAPNEVALHAMCRAAGFARVETKVSQTPRSRSPEWLRRLRRRELPTYRLAVYGFA
jgi:tRNA (mo5U34)-methyltransferase